MVIFLNFTVFTRVEPGSREEVVMVRELFLEAFEMDTQGVFASDVIHTKEMVDSLVRLHQTQLFWMDAKILPLNVPHEISLIVSRQLLL